MKIKLLKIINENSDDNDVERIFDKLLNNKEDWMAG